MRGVPTSHTKPELHMAALLRSWGYNEFITPPISRIIVEGREWPIEPDILFPKIKVCIFVHGKYFHLPSKTKTRKLRMKKDAAKEELLKMNNYIVLTFYDDAVNAAHDYHMKKKFRKEELANKACAAYINIKFVVDSALKGK